MSQHLTTSRAVPARRAALLRAVLLGGLVLMLAPQPTLLPIAHALRTAQTATAQQDYALAARALTTAAERLPYAGYLQYRAGLANISAQNFDVAIRQLQAAVALEGWTPQKHVALGDAYLGQGQREEALAQWELAQPDLPEDDALLARLANNYEALGRYDQAVAALSHLARLRATDATVYYRLALLTAATAPEDALARLALVAELSAELRPTALALQQAIEIGTATGNAAYTFGRVGFAFVQLHEWPLAELALTRALAADPTYADAYFYLGLAQDMQGHDGLTNYETAVKLAPASPLAHFFLGRHWRQKGDVAQALPHLQTAQALDPQNPALAVEVGAAYAAQGDLLNAEIWYVNAVKINERDPQFWLFLAQFYNDNEYHVAELGLPAARMAVTLDEDSALAADALGYALVLTDDVVNGEKMLTRALSLDNQSPSIYYHLGRLQMKLGQTPEATESFKAVLRLDPNGQFGQWAVRALAQIAPTP